MIRSTSLGGLHVDRWITDTQISKRFPYYTRANADEVGPDPFSPLGWSLGWIQGCIPGVAQGFVDFGVLEHSEFALDPPEVFGNWGGYFYNQLSLPRLMGCRMPGATPAAIDQAYFGDHPGVPDYEPHPDDENAKQSEKLANTMAEFGRIDVWVNNVGGSDDKTTRALIDTPDDVFRSQLELNLTSAFQGRKAAAKRMTNGGSIINISSGAGTRGSPFTGPYAAAKAGMNNLTQTLALELAPSIRVNAVAPGPVVTEAFIDVLNVESELDDIAATIPLARLGTPQDIAAAVVYFATPASSWITGQLLLVAGGRTQRTHTYKPK